MIIYKSIFDRAKVLKETDSNIIKLLKKDENPYVIDKKTMCCNKFKENNSLVLIKEGKILSYASNNKIVFGEEIIHEYFKIQFCPHCKKEISIEISKETVDFTEKLIPLINQANIILEELKKEKDYNKKYELDKKRNLLFNDIFKIIYGEINVIS